MSVLLKEETVLYTRKYSMFTYIKCFSQTCKHTQQRELQIIFAATALYLRV
jgi:hypothetical protein